MGIQVILSICSALLENLLFSGVLFGWPTLQILLEKEGFFPDDCTPVTSNETRTTTARTEVISCAEKEAKFNLVFTLASNFILFLSFPMGYALDHFGPWIFRLFACSIFTLGYVFITVSTPSESNLIFPGVIFIGIGGFGFLISNLGLTNLARRHRGIISTIINGFFDSAPVVFFLVKKIFDAGVKFQTIFHFLTWLSILPWIKTFTLMPKKTVPFPLPSNYKYGWQEWVCFRQSNKSNNGLEEELSTSNPSSTGTNNDTSKGSVENEDKGNRSLKHCLKNVLFWTNAFHYAIVVFRVNFYFGSLVGWLRGYNNIDEIGNLADVLGIILLFSALQSPIHGFIIEGVIKFNKQFTNDQKVLNLRGLSASMCTTSLLGIMLSAVVLIPSAYASFGILFFTKAFVYAGHSAFLIMVFPAEHLGKLFGIDNFIAGLLGLLQFGLFRLALDVDPNFTNSHISLLVLTSLTLVHPAALYFVSKQQLTSRQG